MTNEEAAKILNTVLSFGRCDCQKEEIEECLKMAIKALEQTRWIPCTERLPKDGDTYLVTIEYKGEVIGVDAASYSPVEGYIDKHWDTFNDWKEDEDSCYHVSAWMPLPKPYKAESRNVLAEIKAEIEQKCCITVGSENEPAITLYDVFQIIDKYKAERKEEPAEWIVDTDDSRRWDRVRYYCSACNSWNTYGKSKYCPNCGRRMQSEGLQRENS